MNTSYTVKNFRVFDKEGAHMVLRPMTVLTGSNNSGKSSIVKSLMLLNDFYISARNARKDEMPRLDFSQSPLSTLGNFNTVLNDHVPKKGEGRSITFQYDVPSKMLGKTVSVCMKFGADENDRRQNGFIKDIAITDSDGKVFFCEHFFNRFDKNIFSARETWGQGDSNISLSCFKKSFFLLYYTFSILSEADKKYKSYIEASNNWGKKIGSMFFKEDKAQLRKIKDVLGWNAILDFVECYSINMENKLFDMDKVGLVGAAMSEDILFYLPILSNLKDLSPRDVGLFLNGLIKEDVTNPAYYYNTIRYLVKNYQESGLTSFVDYYRSLEDDHLNRDRMLGSFSNLEDIEDVDAPGPVSSRMQSASKPRPQYDDHIFSKVFRLLADLDPEREPFVDISVNISKDPSCPDEIYYSHRVFDDFYKYRTACINEILCNDVCQNLQYVGSSRIEVKRFYSMDNGQEFSKTVTNYVEAIRSFLGKRYYSNKNKYVPGTFLNKWIRNFEIGYKLEVEPLPDGLGVVIKVYSSKEDKKGRLLADYGYGISQLVSVLLEVETAILSREVIPEHYAVDRSKGTISWNTLFDQITTNSYKPRTIAIEEPEIHLHPRFQSLLTEMFVEAMKEYNLNFILETHSEYIIRKLQNLVANKNIDKESISLLYVENAGKGQRVRRIEIAEDGCLTSPFGPGFFDEADSLAMSLLEIKAGVVKAQTKKR